MHTRAMRVLRGTATALFATFAAALSHQLAGGVAPSAFGMGVSMILAVTICTLLAGRTVSLGRLSVAILSSQALYHLLFSSMLAPEGIAPHNMAAMSFDFTSAAQSADSAMSVSHLTAAVVTIFAVRYAEVALWGLLITARMFVSRLLRSVAPVSLHGAQLRLPLQTSQVATFATRFLSTMRYRGPPVTAFAA